MNPTQSIPHGNTFVDAGSLAPGQKKKRSPWSIGTLQIHNIIDLIALHHFSNANYTQAQLARSLAQAYPGFCEGSNKKAVTRLLEMGLIEEVEGDRIPMSQGGGKVYQISRAGKEEFEEVLRSIGVY
jgi:DNA-binding PadR family transcriptional regulator